MSRSIDEKPDLTIAAAAVVLSARSIVLSAPGRGEDLQIRVSAPSVGSDLPIIVFSHGNASSMDGCAPLADYWAARGFAVIQPTHLDVKRLGLAADDPRAPDFLRFRIEGNRAPHFIFIPSHPNPASSQPTTRGSATASRPSSQPAVSGGISKLDHSYFG